MNRQAFEYLYIHANSLAELALDRLARDLEASMAALPPVALPVDAEAQALAQLAAMDMSSMMDGFAWDTDEGDAAALRVLAELQAEAASEPPPGPTANLGADAAPVVGDGGDGGDGAAPAEPSAFDLGQYLGQAYAASTQIAGRVDAAWAAVNAQALAEQLAALPSDAAPLTAPMDAAAFEAWLDRYCAGDPVLDALVTQVRSAAVA